MLPDLESLACFEAAARTLSFRQAAALVHLSPVAFGDRIRRLEEGLGGALFVRTTRKVELTAAGQRLIAHANRLLSDARACQQVVQSAAPLPFEVTIGTRYELGMSWILPALDALSASRPERTIHLYFGHGTDLLAKVRSGGVDAAISSARLNNTGIQYAPLHEESYAFVASRALVGPKRPKGAKQVAGWTLIDSQRDLPLFRYFQDAVHEDFGFRKIEYFSTIAAIRARVLEGRGVAVLPEYFVRKDLREGDLVRLFSEVKLGTDTFRLIWREGHPLEAELRILADALRQRPLE